MRIILAHNHFTVQGGAEFFYLEVGRVLEERGHEVAYFSIAQEGQSTPWQEYFPKGNEFRGKNLVSGILTFPRMVYSFDAKRSMERLIADFKPDLIHVFAIYLHLTPSILDAASKAKIPILMSCNDYKHICPNYKLFHHGKVCEECKGGKYIRAAINKCAHDSRMISVASSLEAYVHEFLNIYRKNVNMYLFASEFMAKKTEEFWGRDSFTWRKLRNPFNPFECTPNYEPGEYVLYFGRIIDEKGVDVLVEAATMTPKIPVVIVGDGPDLHQLEVAVRESGATNIQFLGAQWGEDLNEIVRQCRFVVVPSLWHENFPYVILQSFAHAKPVIGTKRGGIPELVEHGSRGLTYEASSSQELAEQIDRLFSNVELVIEMGRNCRSYVEAEFNDDKFYGSLIEIYEEAVG